MMPHHIAVRKQNMCFAGIFSAPCCCYHLLCTLRFHGTFCGHKGCFVLLKEWLKLGIGSSRL
jgi:hypothetical protein